MSQIESAFSQLRVLILEDSAAMRSILRSILSALGCHQISLHGDALDALDAAEHFVPDIVLCDYHLEDLDGLEFVHQLRASESAGLAMTPVIMVTSYTDREKIRSYINAGADEVLAKPVSAEGLYARVAAVVNRRRPFVRTSVYFGPDRRRTDLPFDADDRRAG